MKIVYTEAAKKELAAFHSRQEEMLQSLVADSKAVLGDDVLEITASDIIAASRNIRALRPAARKRRAARTITSVYVATGIMLMAGAFFYPRITAILIENRTQALIFLFGAMLTALGGLFRIWTLNREREAQHQFEDLIVKANAERFFLYGGDALARTKMAPHTDIDERNVISGNVVTGDAVTGSGVARKTTIEY